MKRTFFRENPPRKKTGCIIIATGIESVTPCERSDLLPLKTGEPLAGRPLHIKRLNKFLLKETVP
jgi:hypothetical protein